MSHRSRIYASIIERIFLERYVDGATRVLFDREDIVNTANALGIPLPKNLGDVVYSFKYRRDLPESIRERAPEGLTWIIMSRGRSRYEFVASQVSHITPNKMLAETKVPDATPGIITMYSLNDEQSLLAKLRYNRLIDIFTGVTCYSLQSHLRTTVTGMGQIETDEIYVGVDKRGAHYVFPVQAKGGNDRLSIVQIVQDLALCAEKFQGLICYPIAAQFMASDLIALFAFEEGDTGIRLSSEKHYRLVPSDSLGPLELATYRSRRLDTLS